MMTSNQVHYVVHVSGGLTSFWALKRTIELAGTENTTGYFADTKGAKDKDNIHAGEDQDTYRFLRDIAVHLGAKIYRVADGRNIWDIMRHKRAIRMYNEYTPCSAILKTELLDRVIAERHGSNIVQVFGMNWHEEHRMMRVSQAKDTKVWFPLLAIPFVENEDILAYLAEHNIQPPRLYAKGFEHNNCGGFCVRAGFAHFAQLYYAMPDRYLYHENRELEFIEHIGKVITILKRKRKGVIEYITLRDFRLELESGTAKYSRNDIGGCGCYTSGYAISAT
jgi:hypothetical protein